MKKKRTKMKAKDFDKAFDTGEDMSELLDFSKGRRPNQEIRRVNVDFPVWLIEALDGEANRLGVSRQSLIKIWLSQRFDGPQTPNMRLRKEMVAGMEALNRLGVVEQSALEKFKQSLQEKPKKFSARRVKKLRTMLDLEEKAFSELLSVSPTKIRNWETGKSSPSNVEAKLLGLIESELGQ